VLITHTELAERGAMLRLALPAEFPPPQERLPSTSRRRRSSVPGAATCCAGSCARAVRRRCSSSRTPKMVHTGWRASTISKSLRPARSRRRR